MGVQNKQSLFTNEVLINKKGQLYFQKSFLFLFTIRFFRFVFKNN